MLPDGSPSRTNIPQAVSDALTKGLYILLWLSGVVVLLCICYLCVVIVDLLWSVVLLIWSIEAMVF